MSNLDLHPTSVLCGGPDGPSRTPVHDLIRGREVPLGESSRVRRLLPTLGRRLVGAWCFVDHYGPDNIAEAPGMQVCAGWLKTIVPEVPVRFISAGDPYWRPL